MSDEDVRQALRVIARHGTPGLEQLLEAFPILKHEPAFLAPPGGPKGFARRVELEVVEQWQSLHTYELQFPPDWRVRILMPWLGATVRFVVNDAVSVYYDATGRLQTEPGWEVASLFGEGELRRFAPADTEGMLFYVEELLLG